MTENINTQGNALIDIVISKGVSEYDAAMRRFHLHRFRKVALGVIFLFAIAASVTLYCFKYSAPVSTLQLVDGIQALMEINSDDIDEIYVTPRGKKVFLSVKMKSGYVGEYVMYNEDGEAVMIMSKNN